MEAEPRGRNDLPLVPNPILLKRAWSKRFVTDDSGTIVIVQSFMSFMPNSSTHNLNEQWRHGLEALFNIQEPKLFPTTLQLALLAL